jgi:protein O-mannosyl-transferase
VYARTTRLDAALWLLIAAGTCLLYSAAADFQLVNLDDPAYIHGSPHLREGLTVRSLEWALSEYRPVYWHPMTWISYLIDVEVFGFGPRGHHMTNVLLHALTAACVFLLLQLATGRRAASLVVAGLFATHPLHVESFAWIAERKDVLCGFFFVTSLIAYVKGRTDDPARQDTEGRLPSTWLVVSFVLFVFACASKPMAVTLPFVLLLLDYWPLGRLSIRDKVPFFAVSVATAAVTLWAQLRVSAVHTGDIIPLGLRAANAVVSYAAYLGKTLWPTRLAVFYPYRYEIAPSIVVIGVLLLTAITTTAVRYRREHPQVLFGWLFFLGTLFPVIGLVQAGNQAMADRFMYIPMLGLLVAIVFSAETIGVRISPPALAFAAIATITALAIASFNQLAYWRDSVTLFTRALAVTERNSLAHTCLGLAYADRGDRSAATAQFQKAIVVGIREVEIEGVPRKIYGDWIADAYAGLARLEQKAGQHQRAARLFEMAARVRPSAANFHDAVTESRLAGGDLRGSSAYALGEARVSSDALDRIGTAYLLRGDDRAALTLFSEALRRSPRAAGTRVKYAVVLAHTGAVPAAIEEMERALRDNPTLVEAHVEIALLLDRTGRPADARARLRDSLRIDPHTTRRYFASRTGAPLPAL